MVHVRSDNSRTPVIPSIPVRTTADVVEALRGVVDAHLSMVELRIDEFRNDPGQIATTLCACPDLCAILTARSSREGGTCDATFDDRLDLLMGARGESSAYVDVEWLDVAEDPERLGRVKETIAEDRLIISSHLLTPLDQPGALAALVRTRLTEMRGAFPRAIPKIAFTTATIAETWTAFDLMHDAASNNNVPRPILIAMGGPGTWTRILGARFGSSGCFGWWKAGGATAPGQLDARDLKGLYCVSSVGPDTRVYGVIGNPVGHSLSPTLHNFWFRQNGIDAVYVPVEVDATPAALSSFLDDCVARNWMNFGGFSITIPHKAHALHWAGDRADRHAASIGAINTIAFLRDGIYATNTDCHAAVDAICMALDGRRIDLAGTSFDILGCGGAAIALCAALRDIGCPVTLYARNEERVQDVADSLNKSGRFVEPRSWNRLHERDGRIVANTTPVGMWPAVDDSPITGDALVGSLLVFDMIYRPLETKMLRDARERGIRTLNGMEMFLRQAAAQFALWTGVDPDIAAGRAALLETLQRVQETD